MTIILCSDDKNGISFNKRRQSRDKVLIENVIKYGNIHVMKHSSGLFSGYDVNIIDDVNNLPNNAVYFHEITDPKDIIKNFDTIIIYRWNRHYPSDVKFEFTMNDYKKIHEEEFAGFSHDKITKEVYVKK